MLKALLLFLALAPPSLAKAEKAPVKKDDRRIGIGIGGGIFTVYPPMVTLDGTWRPSKWFSVGAEAGYLTVPVQQFAGSSSYVGVDGRYFFAGNWHAGLSLGRRSFDITTKNTLTVGETSTEVAWTRHVKQQIVYPRLGWMSTSKSGDAVIVAGGLVVPFGTSFSIEHDPERIEGGLTAAELASEEETRADDVKQVTNRPWPSFEIKYAHFFDWLK